jgi:uncharacterized protein DUF4365
LHDYGIDLTITTYNARGEVENGDLLFQLKATDHLRRSADGESVFLRIDRADLRSWRGEVFPVILVLYDAVADTAYWLYIQSFLATDSGARALRGAGRLTLRVPVQNVLNPDAMRYFARCRDQISAQLAGQVRHHEES